MWTSCIELRAGGGQGSSGWDLSLVLGTLSHSVCYPDLSTALAGSSSLRAFLLILDDLLCPVTQFTNFVYTLRYLFNPPIVFFH